MIQSKKTALYDFIYQKRAIIKRKYRAFELVFNTQTAICKFDDYAVNTIEQPIYSGSILTNNLVQTGTQLVEVLEFIKSVDFKIPFIEVQQLFEMLQNPILITENFANEVEKMVTIGGLYKCQNSLNDDGTTDYGFTPNDWEICV